MNGMTADTLPGDTPPVVIESAFRRTVILFSVIIAGGLQTLSATIANAVLRSGDEAQILTTDGRRTPLLSHHSEMGAALEFLALLEGGRPDVDVQPIAEGSVVVAVSASPDVIDDDRARHELAERLEASLIVTYGAGHRSTPAPAVDYEGGWIHRTGPGQLPGLWRVPALAGRGVVDPV